MIRFEYLDKSTPYKKFKYFYNRASLKSEKNIDAACISSFNTSNKEITSRFVNIKYVKKNKLFFFSNYNSPKALDFSLHDQVAVNFFWKTINVQIRILGHIKKASSQESDKHFEKRDVNSNALAISSNQSNIIKSYSEVRSNFNKTLQSETFKKRKRPKYWGGYSIKPYYFEFWTGRKHRLNERQAFELRAAGWAKYFLEP